MHIHNWKIFMWCLMEHHVQWLRPHNYDCNCSKTNFLSVTISSIILIRWAAPNTTYYYLWMQFHIEFHVLLVLWLFCGFSDSIMHCVKEYWMWIWKWWWSVMRISVIIALLLLLSWLCWYTYGFKICAITYVIFVKGFVMNLLLDSAL